MAKDDKHTHVHVSIEVHDHGPDVPCPGDGEVVFDDTENEGGGPAKYNSSAFRNGWDRIFGNKN